MENKEYLDEEEYQKSNKKVKKIGLIVLIIGLIMLFSGITMEIIGAINKIIELQGGGAPLIVLGIGVTIWGCQVRFLLANQRQISAYFAQQQIPVNKEHLEKMSPSMGTAAKEIAKGVKEGLSDDNRIYCKYCGAQIDSDSSFCKNCGKQLV